MAGLKQDVLGLDVAVYDAVGVGKAQRVGDFAGDLQRVVQGQLLLALQPVAQRLPLHVRHHVVQQTDRRARVVEGQDVRVGELSRDLDLAEEPLAADHCSELGPQHLYCHGAVMLPVLGVKHDSHAPVAELALDGVAFG